MIKLAGIYVSMYMTSEETLELTSSVLALPHHGMTSLCHDRMDAA